MGMKMGIYGIPIKWFIGIIFIAGMYIGASWAVSNPSEAKTFVETTRSVIVEGLDGLRNFINHPSVPDVGSPNT